MEVLVVLAENAGRLTERGEILERVWGGAHLAEDPMTRAISELRKVFGDDPKSPRFIETIHGKGYRLIAEVVGPEDPSREAKETSEHQDRRSLSRRVLWVALAASALIATAAIYLLRMRSQPGPHSFENLRQIPITSYPGLESQPALSPDGSRVAYVREMGDGNNGDVFIKQRNTERALQLTETPHIELNPVWSPDGTEVAFVRLQEDGCGIFSVPAIGGPERLLHRCVGSVLGYDWSPDGGELVIADQTFEAQGVGLALVKISSGEIQQLTVSNFPTFLDTSPKFSPSGREIAFRRRIGVGVYEILVFDRAARELQTITTDRSDNGGFDWTSDGKSIVVSSNRSGVFALWRVKVSTGEFEWLGFENAYLPSIASSGGGLVFEKRNLDLDLWRVPNPRRDSEGASSRWASSTRYDIDPQYSPNGMSVAFVSQRSGSYELWTVSADGEDPRQLTYFDKPAPAWSPSVQHPRWSGDGSEILFSARDGDDFDVFVVRADGGSPRPLTSSAADDLSPVWIMGGRWVYFVSDRTGSWRLWRVSMDGGRPEEVAADVIVPTIESDGGETLYYEEPGGGIMRLAIQAVRSDRSDRTDAGRLVGAPVERANWCLDPGGIYSLRGRELTYYDFDKGQGETWTLEDAKTPAGGVAVVASSLSVSPDGEWLLYSGVGQREADVMMVDAPF
jgi:Tol biopolymer transport system component